jgi:hypothetical protein
MYCIQVADAAGKVKQSVSGANYARLLCTLAYEEGDSIAFLADAQHCVVQVDQALPETMVYLPQKKFTYKIPKGDFVLAYPPQAFYGDRHILQIRPAREEEKRTRRNLALNPLDQRFYENCFPHASANVETRDEPAFFARSVIDGLKFNVSHGNWPYQSWGIGGRADAEITVHFGRAVRMDEVAVTLRADFPHDSWWTKGTLTFSDGQQMTLSFEKTGDTQYFKTGGHTVEWVRLSELVKAKNLSPYPALTEWEVFGYDLA